MQRHLKRIEAERQVKMFRDMLHASEERVHELDSFEIVADEYEEIRKEIDVLCDKRRELYPSGFLQSCYLATIRDGRAPRM